MSKLPNLRRKTRSKRKADPQMVWAVKAACSLLAEEADTVAVHVETIVGYFIDAVVEAAKQDPKIRKVVTDYIADRAADGLQRPSRRRA